MALRYVESAVVTIFTRDILEEQEAEATNKRKQEIGEEDDSEADWAPYEEEQTKTKMRLCNVRSKECEKKCSQCKNVFCEYDLLALVVTE